MENKKTNVKPQMKGGPRGRGMRHTTERAKDVKGSLGKLIKYLKPFYISICISIILAMAGTIFNLVGPHLT